MLGPSDGARIVTYLRPLHNIPKEPCMRFKLTYEGPLQSSQRNPQCGQRNPLAQHKHGIRKKFHVQLKQLWRTNRFLKEHIVDAKEWSGQSAASANIVRRE